MMTNKRAMILALASIWTASAQQPSKGTKRVSLMDPVLQMEAYSLQIPANWVFEGTMVPGPSCAPLQRAVYRAVSPDGIVQSKALPGASWSWGRTPQTFDTAKKSDDCLNWTREVTAAEFLKYMIGVLQVEFVRDEALPGPVMAQFRETIRKNNASYAAQTPPGQPVLTQTGDRTAARVRYKVNATPVEEVVSATVTCTDAPQVLIPSGWGHIHTCSGMVFRNRARSADLDGMKPAFDAILGSIAINQQWMQKWAATVKEIGKGAIEAGKEAEERLLRFNAQITAAHDVQIRQQQDMQAVTKRGTEGVLAGDVKRTSEQSRISHDWADFALDQQKRMDPTTGKVTKDSSLYSYTWVNEFGERYQTNDINYNPNGVLKGNWTLQTNIR